MKKKAKKKTAVKKKAIDFNLAELTYIREMAMSVRGALAMPICRSIFDKCNNEISVRTPKKKPQSKDKKT